MMFEAPPTPRLVTPSGDENSAIRILREKRGEERGRGYEVQYAAPGYRPRGDHGDAAANLGDLFQAREQVWAGADDRRLWHALRWWARDKHDEEAPQIYAGIPLAGGCVVEEVFPDLTRGSRRLLDWRTLRDWVQTQTAGGERSLFLGVDTAGLFVATSNLPNRGFGEFEGTARGHDRLRQELRQLTSWESAANGGLYAIYLARTFWAYRRIKAEESKLRWVNPLVVMPPDKRVGVPYADLWGDIDLEEAAKKAGLPGEATAQELVRAREVVEAAAARLRPLGLFGRSTLELLKGLGDLQKEASAGGDGLAAFVQAAQAWSAHELHIEALIHCRVLWEFAWREENEGSEGPAGPPWYRRYQNHQISPFFKALFRVD